MIERITEDEFIAKIESSAEWATKECPGSWVLFMRSEPEGLVLKFLGPDLRNKPLGEWIHFGNRIFETSLGNSNWRPDKFDIRSELPEGDLE